MPNKFEDLPIFKEAHPFVLAIYRLTANFPSNEKFGLVSQLRRSAASIPANIIEGNSRNHKGEYLEFLFIAKGSLEETKYHLLLAKDLGYVDNQVYDSLQKRVETIGRQLSGLIQYVKTKK